MEVINRLRTVDRTKFAVAFLTLAFFAGCSATTTLQSTQPNTEIKVKTTTQTTIPRTESFSTTSFGNYEFEAKAQGHEPMYGLLPLKFNGGYLAMDILFFAPATFFNLREVFPYYQFDVASGVIRYKKIETEEWTSYTPQPDEADRAKKFFVKIQ
jgi:hypothetical protein